MQYTDVLQYTGTEEGRINATKNAYEYFLKDHLGNVRMVLTEAAPVNYYPAATLEDTYDASTNSMVNYERNFYNISSAYIVPETSIPSWGTETVANTKLYYNNNGNPPPNTSYPTGCTPTQTDGSNNLYKLNATTNRTGLEFMIKVMAGDHIDMFGKSYYLNTTNITNANSTALDVTTLMTNFLLAPANVAAGKGFTQSTLSSINGGSTLNNFIRGNNNEPTTQMPKAYINFMFFDEQFHFVSGNASRLGTSGTVKDHWTTDAQLQNIIAPQNGYIFVYVSNESNFDVFFDNLIVQQRSGPITEETHYYPFGLTMAGISSQAAGGLENKHKYNGKELQHKEFSDGSGLENYDYGARFYDQQIGRWHKIDNKAELYKNITPYAYSGNQPTNAIDPDGNLIIFVNGQNLSSGGSAAYWKNPNGQNFDVAVQKHFNDLTSPRYYDGSSGGWANTVQNSYNPLFSIFTDDNRIAQDRQDAGHSQGMNDARSILISLHRTGGVIDESLKIVTHSMGGAYAKGFVKAIVEYAKAHPEISNGLKISEFDFDPFQAGELKVEPKVHTEQYTHNGKKHIPWWKFWDTDKIADEQQKGLEPNNPDGDNNTYREDPAKTTHDISTFYDDIQNLQEGTYKLIDGKWVKQ